MDPTGYPPMDEPSVRRLLASPVPSGSHCPWGCSTPEYPEPLFVDGSDVPWMREGYRCVTCGRLFTKYWYWADELPEGGLEGRHILPGIPPDATVRGIDGIWYYRSLRPRFDPPPARPTGRRNRTSKGKHPPR
jgi:hypothetical protein